MKDDIWRSRHRYIFLYFICMVFDARRGRKMLFIIRDLKKFFDLVKFIEGITIFFNNN